jgi:hypothetical protein
MPEAECGGRLLPVADPVTGAPRWQALVVSRSVAVAVAAGYGGTARPDGQGRWLAVIPAAALAVTVTGAGQGTLWCRLEGPAGSAVLAVPAGPQPAAAVLRCSAEALPARGLLSARDVRVTTRMGRTVRYLIPEFTPSS